MLRALVQELAVISFRPVPMVHMTPRSTTDLNCPRTPGQEPAALAPGAPALWGRAGLSAFALQELQGADGREPRTQETSYARGVAGGNACDYQGPTGEMG